jgi:CubicO group peptidase (beta-lactamase class C family)
MTIAPEFTEIVERLERDAEEGLFHTGAQVYISVGSEVLVDTAVGYTHLREPMSADTLTALYCSAKPVLTVGILSLINDEELSFSDQLGHVIDGLDSRWLSERTIEQVLGHTAGIHSVNTVLARVLPEGSREQWLANSMPPAGWRFGVDRTYSEFGGWYLLGRAIEDLTEESYSDYLNKAVLEPYGVRTDDLVVRFDDESFERNSDRISVTLDLTMENPVPLLAEAAHDTACEWNPAFGSYGTMRGLGTFYEGVVGDLKGAEKVLPSDLVADATEARLPLTEDSTLERLAGFGLGFMTPLSSHYFGDGPGDEAFGHAGAGGTSFAMADPDGDVVVAVMVNAGLDADTALSFRRRNLVDSIYRALG